MHHFVEGLVIGITVDAVALGALLAVHPSTALRDRASLWGRLRARLARAYVAVTRRLGDASRPSGVPGA